MLSGEKKKYSPYLDTGLMEIVNKKATALNISVNEYITQALIAFIENNPSEKMIEQWVKRLMNSPELKSVLIRELTKYANN